MNLVRHRPGASLQDPDSMWRAHTPAGPVCPPLSGSLEADALVIGAGFTGLSTALNLRRAGIDVTILEAAEPDGGPPGGTTAR
jgi:NADPH-dependent 2,4-dienoyl-CoA reductase/sulfur reductase-like enzyme